MPIDFRGPVEVDYDREGAKLFEETGGFGAIHAAARRWPNKIAVDDGSVQLSYAAFLDRVYGLAARLEVTSAKIIACLVPNSAASPIVTMACAMLSRVLVPLDASHPPERLAAIFAQSGAELLLLPAGQVVPDFLTSGVVPRLVVDPLEQSDAGPPSYSFDLDAPLFVSFTSGSTGRPKGLVSGGRYGGSALRQFVDAFHVNETDVILGIASLSTGGSRDAFAALGTGATIRLVDVRTAGFGAALSAMSESRVTILSFVPSALRMILSVPGAEQAFRHLRILDLHGERILASDIALFREKLPPACRISVTMGSIEAGAVFSWFVDDAMVAGPVVPVGYLLPGREILLLDDHGEPVQDGEVGELVVRGAMAIGGWQEGRMVQGPFLKDDRNSWSRIYVMGDLVRRRPDGLFEYVGRKDRKIKVNGLWADLGEVEAALTAVEEVNEAVVVGFMDQAGAQRIAAFVTLMEGQDPPPIPVFRRAVITATADHMVPSEFHIVPEIPRLANFKPDLVRLRARLNA